MTVPSGIKKETTLNAISRPTNLTRNFQMLLYFARGKCIKKEVNNSGCTGMASLDDGEEEREGNRPKFCTLMKSEPTSLKNLSLQSTQENGYIYI